ncbi:MAG: ABC transporter ATP-binding protein [Corynebacteriales bacterium]|nr:ABC transporter ATP-binding protein [Mycobacteriales bacterium]
MITLNRLTRRYGQKKVVDGLTFEIQSGKVTGFLGPNGAGKSTTLRMVLGLDKPTSGTALVKGKHFAELNHPLREVGALLDAKAAHPSRSARNHLLALARGNSIPATRVNQVLDIVGLHDVQHKRAGSFSLGMGQRLGIAAALLGDPGIVIFDEPVNGLDPDGVRWVRELMRSLAAEGRTVFVSSHLMSEMQLTADHLIIIGRGRLLADAPIGDVIARNSLTTVVVRSPDSAKLHEALLRHGINVAPVNTGELHISGTSAEQVGDLAHEVGARVHTLNTQSASLEQAYVNLTAHSLEYGALQ